MEASILDLRKHMRRVLDALDKNETVRLTYRGRQKALIVPVEQGSKGELRKNPAFGMWAGRADMDDVDKTLRGIRKGRVDAL